MSINWQQQTVVITGSYGGLGQVLCKELSELGAHLIITGRNLEKLNQLKSTLNATTTVLQGDVTTDDFHHDLLILLKDIKSSGHILINNAAISDAQFLQSQSHESIRQMLDINLLAPILLCKSLTPWLEQANNAKIINIGSTFGAIGYPGFASYCATKFGMRGFSQALGRELADTHISVQYLAPRAIATTINSDKVNELNQKLKNNVDTPEQIVPQIIVGIQQNKAEKFFGWPEKLFAKINGIFPSMVSGSIKKELPTIKQTLKQIIK